MAGPSDSRTSPSILLDPDPGETAAGIGLHDARPGILEIPRDRPGLVGVGQVQAKPQPLQDGLGPRRRGRRLAETNGDDEGGTPARLAHQLDATLHGLGETAHDGEAEAGAAEAARGRAVGLHEGLEQAALLLVVEADAGVGDPDAERLAACRLERQPHRAGLGELDGVAQEIEQDLLQAQRIAAHAFGHAGRDIGGELQALGGGLRRQGLGHALDQLDGGEFDAFEVEAAGLDLGEVEDVVDDPQQRRRRIAHRAQRLALLERERRALQHVDHAQDAVHRRADLVAHGGQEGRLGLVGAFGVALRVDRRIAGEPRLVVGDLQAAGEIFLLVGERDVVVLPAMDVAHIGHEMADIGAAGDADQLVERIGGGQQHEQQRRRCGGSEGIEGRRMGRADRHRRGDGGQQHETQQHALQLIVLGGQDVARHAPAGAGEEREAGEPPAPADHLLVGRMGPVEGAPQDVEADGDDDVDGERRREFQEIDLAPVDGGDHRPQHEGEIARLRRALEQAPDELGANERLLAGRQRRRGGLSGRLSRRDGHRASNASVRHKGRRRWWVADQRMVVSCHEARARLCRSECIKNIKKPLYLIEKSCYFV